MLDSYETAPFRVVTEPHDNSTWWPDKDKQGGDDLRDFCLMLRRALYMVIRWIDKRYGCEA